MASLTPTLPAQALKEHYEQCELEARSAEARYNDLRHATYGVTDVSAFLATWDVYYRLYKETLSKFEELEQVFQVADKLVQIGFARKKAIRSRRHSSMMGLRDSLVAVHQSFSRNRLNDLDRQLEYLTRARQHYADVSRTGLSAKVRDHAARVAASIEIQIRDGHLVSTQVEEAINEVDAYILNIEQNERENIYEGEL